MKTLFSLCYVLKQKLSIVRADTDMFKQACNKKLTHIKRNKIINKHTFIWIFFYNGVNKNITLDYTANLFSLILFHIW